MELEITTKARLKKRLQKADLSSMQKDLTSRAEQDKGAEKAEGWRLHFHILVTVIKAWTKKMTLENEDVISIG